MTHIKFPAGRQRAQRGVTKSRAWPTALAVVLALAAPVAVAELKIAVVDSIKAIGQSEEAKSFGEAAGKEMETEAKAVQALQTEITDLQKRLQDEGEVMAEAERRKVLKELENKQIDLDFRAKKLQKERQDQQTEFLQLMGPKVQAIVSDMVEVERYDLVFERSNVGYVNPRHDITAKVTEKLNERFAEAE